MREPGDWHSRAAEARARCVALFMSGDLNGWTQATQDLEALLAEVGIRRRKSRAGNPVIDMSRFPREMMPDLSKVRRAQETLREALANTPGAVVVPAKTAPSAPPARSIAAPPLPKSAPPPRAAEPMRQAVAVVKSKVSSCPAWKRFCGCSEPCR